MADFQDSTVQEIPKGFCQCGCGMRTKIARQSSTENGWIKGEPIRFINRHHARGRLNPSWNNGRRKYKGYIYILMPDHPRATKEGYVPEHILIAEQALGKPLPPQAIIHHVNGKRDNNRPENLVICENTAYHFLLHIRTRALKACGNAHWRKCPFCKEYDDPANMVYVNQGSDSYFHQYCRTIYWRQRRKQVK